MDCPKCGHEQSDTVKCESCGIYFAKVRPPSAVTSSSSRNRQQTEPTQSGFGLGTLAITALVTAAVVLAVVKGSRSKPVNSTTVHVIAVERPWTSWPPRPVAPPIMAAQPTAAQSAPPLTASQAQSTESPDSSNPIEAARRATVLIKTGWGLGSGFIIDADCNVVTNRHVVETDGDKVADEFEQDPHTDERLAAARQELAETLEREQRLRDALNGRPATNLEQAELDRHIAITRQRLADLAPNHLRQAITQKVVGAGHKGFTASLVDGRQFDSLHADFAANSDLALFKLPMTHCPHIPAGHSVGLSFGQRLFTIGNPSGLTYTVTSGVFSGERGTGSERLLQTDAPINPGNSGGPLVTEHGEVVGINTMVLRGTQGIGFAIPIETAFDEFSVLRKARPE
jgi:serine protease Do